MENNKYWHYQGSDASALRMIKNNFVNYESDSESLAAQLTNSEITQHGDYKHNDEEIIKILPRIDTILSKDEQKSKSIAADTIVKLLKSADTYSHGTQAGERLRGRHKDDKGEAEEAEHRKDEDAGARVGESRAHAGERQVQIRPWVE